jgi:hypothetical protein
LPPLHNPCPTQARPIFQSPDTTTLISKSVTSCRPWANTLWKLTTHDVCLETRISSSVCIMVCHRTAPLNEAFTCPPFQEYPRLVAGSELDFLPRGNCARDPDVLSGFPEACLLARTEKGFLNLTCFVSKGNFITTTVRRLFVGSRNSIDSSSGSVLLWNPINRFGPKGLWAAALGRVDPATLNSDPAMLAAELAVREVLSSVCIAIISDSILEKRTSC